MAMQFPSVRITSDQVARLSRMLEELRHEQVYSYPWESLEGDMERQELSRLILVGYGSLINARSAAVTIHSNIVATRFPVIAFGVRRLFNYLMSADGGRYGPAADPLDRAALNVQITGEVSDAANGVLLENTKESIPALRTREAGYDLAPVACLPWADLAAPPFRAYVLSSPTGGQWEAGPLTDRLMPHRAYYQVCRQGAAEFGEDFLDFWLATTYLADGITPASQWERSADPPLSR